MIRKERLFRTFKSGNKVTGNPMFRSDGALHNQAAGQRCRPPLLYLLPYFSGDGDYGLSSKRRHPGARAANCRARSPRTTKLYDRTKDEISLDEIARIKF
jgi:hypothetical protein